MVRAYRVQTFDPSGTKLSDGQVFGVCDECLPAVTSKVQEKYGDRGVLTPTSTNDKLPCYRCKKPALPDPLPAKASRSDPDTSQGAADYMNSDGGVRLTNSQQTIYETMLKHIEEGMTTNEISNESGMKLVTVSARMRDMEELGILYATEERRGTPKSIVWKLKFK